MESFRAKSNQQIFIFIYETTSEFGFHLSKRLYGQEPDPAALLPV